MRSVTSFTPQRPPPALRAPTRSTRRPRRAIAVAAAETARGAIDAGLAAFEAGDAGAALAEFQRALTLPGSGIKRYRDKPAALSDGEVQAAQYNIACARAKLGDVDAAFDALAAAVGAGYNDSQARATLESDPDLAPLRADPRFAAVMARVAAAKKKGGLFGLFGG